jgi:transcription antitermination factor NusG
MVRTGGEPLVSSALISKTYETFLPLYTRCRQYSDRIKKLDCALFPGYVFCRFDPDRRLPVLITPGVHDVVRTGDRPGLVDEAEIENLRKVVAGQNNAVPWSYLRTGDRVRVEVGAMAGVEGFLVREKGTERLVVSVSLLQRSISVEIDRTWVRPV